MIDACQPSEVDPLKAVDAVRLLLDAGCPTHDTDNPLFHLTPMHLAAWFGHAAIVELLIERGGPIEMRDFDHSATPLHWAMEACRREARRSGGDYGRIIQTLLDLGATWDAARLPLGDPEIDAIFEPLLAERFDGVVASEDRARIEKAIVRGVSQAELDLGLCVAAERGMTDVCRRLMQAGAVVCVPEQNGWTALHAAMWFKHHQTAEALLEGGADVHIQNVRGGTVWHALGEGGAPRELIDLIIRHGGLSDINVPSKYDYTPLDLAIIEQHSDTIAHLISLGATTRREEMPQE